MARTLVVYFNEQGDAKMCLWPKVDFEIFVV